MSEFVVEVRRATRRFGALSAVSELDLQIRRGEVVGLIGPNGSGKSTLVNLIAGALAFNSGTLLLDGEVATQWSPQRRCHWGLARTRQIARPLGELTVMENIVVGAIFGAGTFQSYRDAERTVRKVMAELGLAQIATALPTELPIQKLKILEIARALATQPRAILLDESMAGLSSGEASGILELIRQKRRSGMAILLIEHRLPELMSVSDRVVVLNAGTRLFEGSPEVVVNNPEVMRAYLGIETPESSEVEHV
jgi:ABC-type branched-subunit amino acid transport system ATPase component